MKKSIWQKIPPRYAIKLINFWLPYLGAGIKVIHCNHDMTEVTVQMKQRLSNSNYVGVHFGGSLYSMCDPFYMLILMLQLGNDYIVWDKSATIDFLRPGKGTVTAKFEISSECVQEIKEKLMSESKIYPEFETYILDKSGQKIAHVKKTLYVKKK